MAKRKKPKPLPLEDDGAVPPPDPADEPERIATLKSLGILDTLPEREFDEITGLLAHICGVPITLVSLIDSNRQWFKSKFGLDAPETPRRISFCGHAILEDDVMVIPDSFKDPRFSKNPLATGQPVVRFYAGFPLRLSNGHVVGTLCAIDHRPRKLSPKQLNALRVLGRSVVLHFDARLDRLLAQRRIDQATDSLAMANSSLQRKVRAADSLNKKLRASEEKLRLAIDAAGLATWEVDFVADRTTYDETTRLLLNAPEGVYEGDGNLLFRVVHPDDQELVAAAVQKAIRGDGRYEAQHRAVVGDRVFWTVVQGAVEFDSAGEAIKLRGSQFDITPIKDAEAEREKELLARLKLADELKGSQQKLQLALEAAGVGLWEADLVRGKTSFDENLRQMLGLPEGVHEGDGDVLTRVVHPDDRERVFAALDQALKGKAAYNIEHRIVRPDGSEVWTEARGKPEFDEKGKLQSFRGATLDITSKKEAGLARQRELAVQADLAAILERVSDAFIALDRDWTVAHVNEKGARLLGLSIEEMIGKNFVKDFSGRTNSDVAAGYQRALDTQEPVTVEYHNRELNRWFENRVFPSADGVSAYFHEITDRKRSEINLRAAAARQHALSQQLVTSQETEMRRLSQELHDRIGQNLTALRINLKLVGKASVSEASPEVLATRLQDANELVDSTIHAVRTMLRELRPPALDDLGLVPALRGLVDDFAERTGIPATVTGNESAPRPVPDVELAFYRIAQEALNNAAKYSKASKLEIAISGEGGSTEMNIEDDGVGFDASGGKLRASWGMDIMNERARTVGLKLSVDSAPGKGTRVSVGLGARK